MGKVSKHAVKRRDFIKILAGVAASTAMAWSSPTPIHLLGKSPGVVTQERYQWVMVVDQAKCIGCNFCTFACKAVNDTPPDIYWNLVFTEKSVGTKMIYISKPCMQCEDPPCVDVCPAHATYKRDVDGIVVIDYDKCVGCRYCMAACPYGARYFNWKKPTETNLYIPKWGTPEVPRRSRGVVEKCTFCTQRMDKAIQNNLTPGVDPEVTPACVNACPTGARNFGNLRSAVGHPNFGLIPTRVIRTRGIQLLKELGTTPRVYYLPPMVV